jgi:histidine triad (HIT) family protein
MPSVFTRIIDGELPGRFVWKDDHAVVFLSIAPITRGHSLIVPRAEVDHWLDLDPQLWAHCAQLAQIIGRGIQRAFDPPRIGQMIAGFEVPHMHIHVAQIHELADLSFERADPDADPDEMDDAAAAIRLALRDLGHGAHVPAE